MTEISAKKIRNSFDVFDTCLTRLWAEPSDLFVLVGQQLQKMGLIGKEIVDFPEHRRVAELNAWQQENFIKQPSLDQIYCHLAISMKWTKEDSEKALVTEVELEIDGIRVVPETLSIITRLHKNGEPVAYISDMYLSEKVIFKMLLDHGFWQPGDRLFVSADAGFRKHNGLLFRHVRQSLRRPLFSIKHTGDNYRADFIMAWLNGFRGQHFPSGLLHTRETEVLKSTQGGSFGSKIAAISRITRLSYKGPINTKDLWNTVATGFAPLIFSFAFHCLIQAKEKGFSSIFFCSRDGSLPMKVAKIINETYNFGLNINYLRCSRSAWCKTSLTGPDSIGIASALEINKGLTIREVGRRLDISEIYLEEIRTYIGKEIDLDTLLSLTQKEHLIKGFAAGFMHSHLSEIERKNRNACMVYFTQCGMDFNKGFLLVDAFSRGTIESLFNAIIADSTPTTNRTNWVYLEFLNEKKRNSTNSFLKPIEGSLPFSRVALAEALLATNEESLRAYCLKDNGVSFIFDEATGLPEEKVMHEVVHQACIRFAELICQNILLEINNKSTLYLYAVNAFQSLTVNPTYKEAKCLQNLPYESWSKKIVLAKRLGIRDFAKLLRHRLKKNSGELILDGPWMEGSIALADPVSRRLFQLFMRK